MIIACPECGVRYRLAATSLAENTRMRCAACNYRWAIDTAEPIPAPPEPLIVAPPPAAMPETEVEADAAPRSPVLRTLAAVVIGGALALAAAALWLKRVDATQIPLIGDQIATLSSPALPLAVTFTARTTVLTSGDRLLEINGRVTNIGTAQIVLPPLEARLAGPGGTVHRWRIAAPVASLDAGKTLRFASTATGFPADATIVGIRPGR